MLNEKQPIEGWKIIWKFGEFIIGVLRDFRILTSPPQNSEIVIIIFFMFQRRDIHCIYVTVYLPITDQFLVTTQLVKWWCKMNRITRFLTDLNQVTQPFPIITEESSFSFEGNLVWPLKGKLSMSTFAVREKFWWLLGMKKSSFW